jgi:lipopolysaccharide exporter
VNESQTSLGQTRSVTTTKKSGFVSDVLKLTSGTTFAQALSVLVIPILSRIYAPDAFGTATVFVSITGIIGVVSCLRYELAIMLPECDEDAANVLAISLLFVLMISGLSGLVILFASQWIVELLNAPDLASYIWLVPLALLVNGGFLALSSWNSRTRYFGRLSIAQVSQAVVKNGTQLIMGLGGQSHAGGLIGGIVFGSIVVAAVLGGQIWRDDRRLFREHICWHRMLGVLKQYRKFPLLDSWGSLVNTVSALLPALALSIFFSQTTVGYYGQAYQVIGLPVTLVGRSVAQVFFQRVSKVRGEQRHLVRTVEVVFRGMAALGLFPAILLAIVGQDVIVLLFGQDWAETGIYVQILGLWAFFWFVYSPLSTLFATVERQEFFLIAHVAILVARLISLIVGGILGNMYLTLGLFAGLGVLMYGGLAIWSVALVGMPVRSALSILLRYGLYCVPGAGVLLLLKACFSVPIGLMLAVSALALVINYLLVLHYEPVLSRYVKSFLRNKAWLRS